MYRHKELCGYIPQGYIPQGYIFLGYILYYILYLRPSTNIECSKLPYINRRFVSILFIYYIVLHKRILYDTNIGADSLVLVAYSMVL